MFLDLVINTPNSILRQGADIGLPLGETR